MAAKKWTKEEEEVVIRLYPHESSNDIAKLLGRTACSIHCRAHQLGLKSTREKIVRIGKMAANHPKAIATRLKKGHIPHNKGVPMSEEVRKKVAPSWFTKGHQPHNTVPIGSETVTKGGYIKVKVGEPNRWKLKHRILWEQTYGEIPKGYNVQFKDGNPKNITIDNLYLISRKEQLTNENCYFARYPEEFRKLIRMRATLTRVINNREKKNGQEHECK